MNASSTTELLVIRHGETTWNSDGRQQGHLDSPLSALGLRQARAIADRLADERFDVLYSSDLERALRTAECIVAHHDHAIRTDARLRERHLGIFQGLTLAEVAEKWPDVYARFASGDPDYEIPDGESLRQRYERMVAGVRDIAAAHPGQRVVIVAHGGVLDSLFRCTLGIELDQPRRCKLYNASINTVFVDEGAWMMGTWGDVCHLRDIGTQDDW